MNLPRLGANNGFTLGILVGSDNRYTHRWSGSRDESRSWLDRLHICAKSTQHEMWGVDMSYRCDLMLVSGVLLFGVGAITRTYMNIMISRSPLPGSSAARSTELRYRHFVTICSDLRIEILQSRKQQTTAGTAQQMQLVQVNT